MTNIVLHGAFGWATKYEIVQHKYEHTDCEERIQGFAEVLEIKNPPTPKGSILIHIFWNGRGSYYFEFARLIDAMNAFEKILFRPDKTSDMVSILVNEPGYVFYNHTMTTPWFYET
ncbi:MAG: hypothetical protein UT67_C0010G0013 [Candidatus Magasanikbacteria bacterium GW2011_GWA2_40_10]|uniref:Uncharacterized protein n=1 Tax=Candidatus Magasanikbacteria bacterium GW2011_GWA2_40_10 TaxID=1619037 RepID=A0A0G0QBF3_9BACT|nr:MAG: hypothetical protein UT67_C0010G0013 [Candidatus Magasanikbacteria bacterium GW2011_GWA2_40_10]